VLQSQLVLAHLGEDGADVEMDVTRVRDLQTVVNSLLAEVQVIVLDLKGLLEVGKGAAKFLCASEYARKVIVRYSAVTVTLFGQTHRLVEQLQRHLEVLCYERWELG